MNSIIPNSTKLKQILEIKVRERGDNIKAIIADRTKALLPQMTLVSDLVWIKKKRISMISIHIIYLDMNNRYWGKRTCIIEFNSWKSYTAQLLQYAVQQLRGICISK